MADERHSTAGSAIDYMVEPVFTVPIEASLREVDRMLEEQDVSAVVVEDVNGEPVGVISRSDLVRVAVSAKGKKPAHIALELPNKTAGEVMTGGIVSVPPEAPIEEVAQRMVDDEIHRVFVARENVLFGVIGAVEVMRAVAARRIATPLSEIMTRSLITVSADESLAAAAQRIAAESKQGLVVVEDGWPVGIISNVELLLAQHWPGHVPVEEWMQPRVLCLPLTMPVFRAAAHALATDVRHVVAMDDEGMKGIVTGIDFARCLARTERSGAQRREHHAARASH